MATATFSYASSQASDTVLVPVSLNQQVYLDSPISTNFTILSVTGSQAYSIQTQPQNGLNQLTFTPKNGTFFSLVINASSFGANYVDVTKGGSPFSTFSKNFTGQGNLIVNINVNVTSSGSNANYAWDPLVGMLPLKIQSFSLSFIAVIEIFSLLGVLFLSLGIVFHSKVSYLGLAILFIAGAITLGILVLLSIIGIYLFGFATVNLVWRFRSSRDSS